MLDQHAQHFEDPEYWHRHFPWLTLGRVRHGTNPLDDEALDTLQQRAVREGYGQGADPGLKPLAKKLERAVRRCVERKIPLPFIFFFDEPWACFRRQRRFFAHLLGDDYRMVPDIMVWHVDPKADEAGWSPHRDYGKKSLRPDGTPQSLQMWIPLNEANPLNGCMYVLPAFKDPHYNKPTELTFEYDMPHVRALPVRPGDFLFWNGAIIHWGAQSSRYAKAPRISMGVHFQRADYNPLIMPLMDPIEPIDFPMRQKLVAKTMVQYRQRVPIPELLKPPLRKLEHALLMSIAPQ